MPGPKPLDQVYRDLVSFVYEEKTKYTIQDNRLIFIGDNDLSHIIRHFRDTILEWDVDPSVLDRDEMQVLALSRQDQSTWGLDISVDDLVHLLAFLSLSYRANERDLNPIYLSPREQGGTHCKDHQCHVAHVEREVDVISRRLDDTESKYHANNLLEKRVNTVEHTAIRVELALDLLTSQSEENRDVMLKQIAQVNDKFIDLRGELLHDISLQKAINNELTSRLEHKVETLEFKLISKSSYPPSNSATHSPRPIRSDRDSIERDVIDQNSVEATFAISPAKEDFSSSSPHGREGSTEKLDDFLQHQVSPAPELDAASDQPIGDQNLIEAGQANQAPVLLPMSLGISPTIVGATPNGQETKKILHSMVSPKPTSFRRHSTGTLETGVSRPPSRTSSSMGLTCNDADYSRPHSHSFKRPRRNSTGTSNVNIESSPTLTLHMRAYDFPVRNQLVAMLSPITGATDGPTDEALLSALQISVSFLFLWWVICGLWTLVSWVVVKVTSHPELATSSIGEGYALKMNIYAT